SLRITRRSRCLLAGIEEVLWIERVLDRGVQLRALRPELLRKPHTLDRTDAVFPGDRSAEPQREREQLLRHARRPSDRIRIVPVEQVRRVEIAVARVPPGAGRQAEPSADGERLLDAFCEVIERNGDVLARLSAALCV